jgi:DNA adenine methylase
MRKQPTQSPDPSLKVQADAVLPPPKPILRWAGSKRLLVPKLLSLAPVSFDRYIEPFCGSACLFLALRPRKAILSDLNPHVISMYKEVRERPDDVARATMQWRPNKTTFLKVRSNPEKGSLLAAARLLYLNRYSFNGVYRENRQGLFNVPFARQRNGKVAGPSDLKAFSNALRNTRLLCADFEAVVEKAREGDFLYLDPPYHYGKTRNRGEYGYGAFSEGDLERFIRAVASASDRGAKILISYNRAHQLRKQLPGWRLSHCETRRSIAGFSNSRHSVREYLLRNY